VELDEDDDVVFPEDELCVEDPPVLVEPPEPLLLPQAATEPTRTTAQAPNKANLRASTIRSSFRCHRRSDDRSSLM
jgi:hypothetical protein